MAKMTAGPCPGAITRLVRAVFFALYGLPQPGFAQQAPPTAQTSTDVIAEITVTATRREQTLQEVPYSLTVVSADQLTNNGVTDIASLAAQVPGLSYNDFGARLAAAETPIIRGLNGTGESADRPFRTFEQSPVGTYIGNSPIQGYFQLDDVQRIEVLRGPQGTLYGAGALGGALRVIPNDPQLGTFSGNLNTSIGQLAHSGTGGPPYTTGAMINIPFGDTVALRLAGKYAYEPGFIDVYGIVVRSGGPLYGAPVLADPSDPVNSEAIYGGKRDWNDQNTFTGRASLLWKPNDQFSAEAALTYSNLNGDAGPQTNTTYQGGPYFIDPRITFPPGGPYQDIQSFNQPFWRRTSLQSLDMSYDAGFATISSTSSYYTTSGLTQDEGTYGVGGFPGFNAYYGGTPLNPRFVYGQEFTDTAHTYTQEVRLVSTPGKVLDYVVGVFYENQTTTGNWYTTTPGSYEYSVAQGCTAPVYYGSTFPNCLITVGPNDVPFLQSDTQTFQDKSVFGELTWHVIDHGQVTFGARHFHQNFTDAQSYIDYPFFTFIPATPHSAPASKNTYKVNPSYEYADQQYVYAIWSQGFRRGGANSVPLTGIFRESPLLATYAPDSVNNYEAGLKGRFANGVSYTLAVFDMRWDKPQISASLPSGNIAVYNGNTAESKGVEFESSGPLIFRGLTYTIGAAYTDATLTSDFSLPANDGTGTGNIVPGLINGTSGQQLPGSSKVNFAATITYARTLAPGWDFAASINGTYTGQVPLFLSEVQSAYKSPPYGLLNTSTIADARTLALRHLCEKRLGSARGADTRCGQPRIVRPHVAVHGADQYAARDGAQVRIFVLAHTEGKSP